MVRAFFLTLAAAALGLLAYLCKGIYVALTSGQLTVQQSELGSIAIALLIGAAVFSLHEALES